jgi:hypothetical protein
MTWAMPSAPCASRSAAPISLSNKSRSGALLCCFASNENPRVMPTVIDGKREQDRKYDYVPERPNAAQHWSNGDWLVENLVGSLMAQENKDEVGGINQAPDTNRIAKAAQNVPCKAGKVQPSPDSPRKVRYVR